ncbi:MAG: AmmeMemoRadiSam system protein B [Elusimicrobia bacterium]|nr:AmmeMemoRadiSam system protein B [Elusimicrobiota bacterium]
MKFLNLFFLLSLIFFPAGCIAKEDMMTRAPAVAGQFYPSDKKELTKIIDEFLSKTKKQNLNGKIIGLISPHAGYVFSGQTAAWSYKQIEGEKVDTVILIGSSHNYPVKGAALWTGGNFSTPLGEVEIDEQFTKELLLSKIFQSNNNVHTPEHSLEVQLPFLQKILKNFQIVAILINEEQSYKNAAGIIAKTISTSKKSVLLVASTDMTHYPTKKNAELVDKDILKTIERFNPSDLIQADGKWLSKGITELHCTLCGLPAVLTVMETSKILGADKSAIINYSNSAGSPYGDEGRVVGYGAVAFVKTSPKSEVRSPKLEEKEFALVKESQKELLTIARNSIDVYLTTGKIPKFTTTNPELLNNGAVFVTLEKNHNLRGCIGTTEARMPIYEAVTQLAIAAAVEDHRFPPVTKNELKDIKIEISVLSPLKKISSSDEIVEGKHGVVVRKGFRSGLFLPQVWEHPELSKKVAFLSELCRQKAGLEPDAWKKGGADLYTFTVFAFEEEQK